MHVNISDYHCTYVYAPINIIMYKHMPTYNMHGDHITSDISYLIIEHSNINEDNHYIFLLPCILICTMIKTSHVLIAMHTNIH